MSNKSRANKKNQNQNQASSPQASDAPLTEGETASEAEPTPRPYVDLDAIYNVATEAGDGMMKIAASDVRHMVEAITVLAAHKQGIARAVEAAVTIGQAEVLKDLDLESLAKLVAQGSRPPE
jgi:hypothetical protein